MIATSFGPEDTYALGKRLGEAAKAGDVFCLNGDLGVGKTVFTPGLCLRTGDHRAGEQPYLYHCPGV